MSDRIEENLFDLGERISYPTTPTFHILEEQAALPWRPHRGWAVAAGVAAFILVIAALPGPRAAIADFFGIGSVAIVVVDDLPEAPVERIPSGDKVPLGEAAGEVAFDVMMLITEADAVFLDTAVPGGMVTLAYGTGREGYQLLITQLIADTDDLAVKKLLVTGTSVMSVDVEGKDGFWIEGEPHIVILFDRDGQVLEDSARLAGNTLLYTVDDITVRIEADIDLEQALELAGELSRNE